MMHGASRPPYTLSKSSLLTKPWEYKRVYEQGKRIRSPRFSLICLPNDRGGTRLGISIHGIKGGVRRNRIKRIVREFFRHHRNFLDWGKRESCRSSLSMDVVIAIRRDFSLDSPQAIKAAVQELLSRKPFLGREDLPPHH